MNMNRWCPFTLAEKQNHLLASCSNMAQAEQVIYQWVKEDRIGPKQMSEMLIVCFKAFVY